MKQDDKRGLKRARDQDGLDEDAIAATRDELYGPGPADVDEDDAMEYEGNNDDTQVRNVQNTAVVDDDDDQTQMRNMQSNVLYDDDDAETVIHNVQAAVSVPEPVGDNDDTETVVRNIQNVVPVPEPVVDDDDEPPPPISLPPPAILPDVAAQPDVDEDEYEHMMESAIDERKREREDEEPLDYTTLSGYRRQRRYAHFITWDGPEIPSRIIRNLESEGIVRYAIWCKEAGGTTGHVHHHMFIELTRELNAPELEHLLFKEQWRAGQVFNVWVQHINKNRYAARFYIMKGRTKEQFEETWFETGLWTEPGAVRATKVRKLT